MSKANEFDEIIQEEKSDKMLELFEKAVEALSKNSNKAIAQSVEGVKDALIAISKKVDSGDTVLLLEQMELLKSAIQSQNNDASNELVKALMAVVEKNTDSNQNFREAFELLISPVINKLELIESHLKKSEESEWELTVTKRDQYQNLEKATMKRIK